MFVASIVIACDKSEDYNQSNDIEYIKYGTSFGMCLGYCNTSIKISNSNIDFDESGWNLDGILPVISFSENINSKYTTELTQKIDFNSFLKLDTIIGCPDCADGGAEWIEIRKKGKSHKVTFEYLNEPNEIKEYIGYLRTYMNAFQIDSNETVDFNNRTIINQEGIVKNLIATRGSYQWLIGIISNNDTTYYFDEFLDSKFQVDNLNIEFMGTLSYDSITIYKPDQNDIPIPDFKVRLIRTFEITKTVE